jgi:hypothetical protein
MLSRRISPIGTCQFSLSFSFRAAFTHCYGIWTIPDCFPPFMAPHHLQELRNLLVSPSGIADVALLSCDPTAWLEMNTKHLSVILSDYPEITKTLRPSLLEGALFPVRHHLVLSHLLFSINPRGSRRLPLWFC